MKNLIILFCLVCCGFRFSNATGNNTKIWENDKKDKLKCEGFEWHSVVDNENFFKDQHLAKNVFDFYGKRAQFKIDPEIISKKINGHSLDNLESTGYSLFVYFKGEKEVEGSYSLWDQQNKKEMLTNGDWKELTMEYTVNKNKMPTLEEISRFDLDLVFRSSKAENDTSPSYVVISKMYKYLKFSNKEEDGSIKDEVSFFFNFTKNTNDYQVKIDNKDIENLNDFAYWTSLNFENVMKNNLRHLAVSKLHNSVMMLEFKINDSEENFEKSSICLRFKYYHDNGNDDDLPTFEIMTKFRGSKDEDELKFNKLVDYINLKTTTNDLQPQKNWLTLKMCFHKRYLKDNVIYLVSIIKNESQTGHYPSLTNALADFEIERGVERFNDFLYSWSTGLFDPEDEWYTTPIIDDFKFIKDPDTKRTQLELVNKPNAQINVFHFISNAFKLNRNAKLTFNLKNNHTDGTLKIYLIKDNQKRKVIAQFNLNTIQDIEKVVTVNLTNQEPESFSEFTAIDIDDEEIGEDLDKGGKEGDDKKEKEPDENDDDKGEDEGDNDKEPPSGDDKDKDKDNDNDDENDDDDDKDDEDHDHEDDENPKPESYAKLIFEFKLKRLEENESFESLTLFNLNLDDPCDLNFGQCKYGSCQSNSSTNWRCKCNENAHGDKCEYLNMCHSTLSKPYIEKHQLIVPTPDQLNGRTLNGEVYCEFRKSKGCLPIDNRIKCLCDHNMIWNYKTQMCVEIDPCASVYCPESEECYLNADTRQPTCRCKKNFYRNLDSSKCELDYCRAEKDKLKCIDKTQYCINDLINEKAVCECRIGFHKIASGDCVPSFSNEDKTPFIAQYYGCTHGYELSEDKKEYRCNCFSGYKLQDDDKTCKPEFDLKKCPKCTLKQVCIKPDLRALNGEVPKCTCKLGYKNVEKCEPNFCDDKSKIFLIKSTCPAIGSCQLQMVRRAEPIFQCSCKPEITIQNKRSGLCELKSDICNKIEQDKCAETNGFCIPKVINGTLSPHCQCSVGFGMDKKTSFCKPLDELLDCKRFNAFTKYINIKKNKAICSCLPGYVFDPLRKKCVLNSKDTVQVSAVVFLKHISDELDKDEIPESSYVDKHNQLDKIKMYDCANAKLLTKEHCFSLINSAYQPLTVLNKTLMMENIEYQLYQKARNLFYYISGDEGLSISMISFENVTEIDEGEMGFNTKYLVNMALVSDQLKGNKLQENLERLCAEDKREDKDEDLNKLKNFCFLDKRILPVSKVLNITGPLNLCKLKTMQCPAYSSCKHDMKKDHLQNSQNSYSCVCNKGFKSLHKIEEYNLIVEICEDVDECENEDPKQQNDCDKDSTTCENLIGSYRCSCKEGFKRHNTTDCVPICSDSFPCVKGQGECKPFEKNYEICECKDGFKGIDCGKEDSVVILLKEILIFVSVGLGLLLMVTIAIAIFCIKSVRRQKEKNNEQFYLNDLK